jgi:hypothetical protein
MRARVEHGRPPHLNAASRGSHPTHATHARRKPKKTRRFPLLVALLLAGIVAAGAADGYIFLRYIAPSRTSTMLSAPATGAGTTARQLSVASRPTCRIPPQKLRMLTPAELANPTLTGTLVNAEGVIGKCTRKGLAIPPAPGGTPQVAGQVILVSLAKQWLWAYQDQRLVFANPVTTGREFLGTPQGTYTIGQRVSDTWFYSPWPPGSPYYYSPEHVNYALYFRHGGYYIHDAPWRHAFGPGTNVPHVSPDGTSEDGSHGCVNVATTAGRWLFNWVRLGATVIIAN